MWAPSLGITSKSGWNVQITIYKNEPFDISKMEIGSGDDAKQYSEGKGYSNTIYFEAS